MPAIPELRHRSIFPPASSHRHPEYISQSLYHRTGSFRSIRYWYRSRFRGYHFLLNGQCHFGKNIPHLWQADQCQKAFLWFQNLRRSGQRIFLLHRKDQRSRHWAGRQIISEREHIFFLRISSFSSINGTSLFHDQHSYLHPDNYTIDGIALHLF